MSQAQPSTQRRLRAARSVFILRHITIGIGLLCIFAFLLSVFGRDITIDQAIFVLHAQQWLLGRELYVSIQDVHPPQIYFLHAIPVLLSLATHWSIVFSFNLIVSLLAVFAGYLFGLATTPPYRFIAGALWASALMLAAHDYFFGQREYFFMLAWIPYLLSRTGAGSPPRWVQIASGALLGFLICVKPHFALIAGGTEAWLWLRWRSQCRWLPFVIFVAVGTLQIIIFFALFDFSAYRHDVQIFDYYNGLGVHYVDTLMGMIRTPVFQVSLLGGALVVGPIAQKGRLHPFVEACIATVFLGLVLGVLQGTFRLYYLIPIYFAVIAMLVVLLCQPRQDVNIRRLVSFPFAYEAWTLCAILCLILFAYQPYTGIVRLAGKEYLQGYQYQRFGGLRPDFFADWVAKHVPARDTVSVIAPQYGDDLYDPIVSMLHVGRPVLSRTGGLELNFSLAEATGNRRSGCQAIDGIRRDIVESDSGWVFIRREMPSWASANGADPIVHFQHYPSFWRWFVGSFYQSDQFGKYSVYRRRAPFSADDDVAALPCP